MGKSAVNVTGIDKQMYTSSSENNAFSIGKNDTIVDFLLSQNKNTLWLGKDSIDSVEKAEKYLSNNLSFDVDNESILMNKDYNGRTIFEKYIEPYFDERFMFAISCLVSGDISLKNILLMPIDGRYVFEYLEEKGLNLTINYLVIANDADACLELIERGYDKLLSYIGNPKVLACVTSSGETIFDKLLSYYIKDKYFLERIKKYLNDDFSFKEEAINLDSNDYHRFLAQVRDCSLIRSMWFTTQYISFMVKRIPQNIIYKYLMNNYMATQTFLDLLLLCKLTIPEVNNLAFEDEEMAKFYIKYGFYRGLGLADSNILLMKTDSGCV